MKTNKNIPLDGIQGLKQNFSSDFTSGFLVFLLALPLSLGIAKASDFPPMMGLVTAMVGGLVVSLFSGSKLTIKGPAAGLIVIVAGSVAELGGGNNELGWNLALGAIAAAGVIQVLFGFFKLGKFVDFFPLSAVHGMLAAIGLIIMSKQIHILLGINPTTEAGKPMVEPLELIGEIPHSFSNFNGNASLIGIICLLIVFLWPKVKHPFLKKIPAPVLVLLTAIPLAKVLNLDSKLFIHFDKDLFHTLSFHTNFDGFSQTGTFLKYVLMFALVGSLESLLTVKAIDLLDPFKRKSNYNKDLIAVGFGNILSSLLGGLPMISEVARSSSNVANGAQTRWANFFHGFFIFLFLCFAVTFSDLIPNTALAAMLIGVGFRLASPKEFSKMFKIGPEQLFVFLITILGTLATDLLVGMIAGIVVKMILHYFQGVTWIQTFKVILKKKDQSLWEINSSIVFSNWSSLQKEMSKISRTDRFTLDFSNSTVVDHTAMENLHHLKQEFLQEGGELIILGIDELKPTSKSNHPLSARRKVKA